MVARAAVVAVAIGLYLGTLGHGFTFDDASVVQSQEIVRSHRFLDAFTTPYHTDAASSAGTGLYRPLTILSFAVQDALHHGRPMAFHAANVALHAVAALCVLELALALSLPLMAASGAALLFAAHPVHVEAVAGIAGRAELSSAVFYLAALLAYAKREDVAGRVGTAALLFLSLLCKETAVTFPAAAGAWELLVRRDAGVPVSAYVKARRRELVYGAVAVLVPIAAYLVIRHAVLGAMLVPASSITRIENPAIGLGLAGRLATAVAFAGKYAVLLVAPVRLSPDWGFAELAPVHSVLDPGFLLGAAALIAGTLLFAATYRRHREAAFCLLFGAAGYSLVSNTVIVIGIGVAERLIYLPSAAFCILAALGLQAIASRSGYRPAAGAAAVILVAFAARTVVGARAWRDDLTLFSTAEHAAPRSVKILGNLAVELIARGRWDEARRRLERAVALAPDHVLTQINLSGVLLQMGDLPAAESHDRTALALDPGQPVAWAQLGAIFEKRGQTQEAEGALRKAVDADPRFIAAHMDLARLLAGREAWDDAERELRRVLELDPRSAPARQGLAFVEERRAAAKGSP